MFLDETGLSTSLHQSKVYAKKGMPAPVIHRHIRGASRSIIGVVTTDGKSSYSVMKKALNKVSFEEFIRNHIIPIATKPYTLIMDNLSIHKNKACLELLKKHQIEVIFQPPYSPEYNPIEFVWGWVKKSLRRGMERNIDDLVNQFINKIKQTNIKLIKSFALKSGYIDNTISNKLDCG